MVRSWGKGFGRLGFAIAAEDLFGAMPSRDRVHNNSLVYKRAVALIDKLVCMRVAGSETISCIMQTSGV